MKTTIQLILYDMGLELGCWDSDMDKLTKKAFWEVVNSFDGSSTDVFLRMRRKLYVVSISVVDSEVDFCVRTGYEYFDEFGGICDAFEVGKITEDEYQYYMKQSYGDGGWIWDGE